MRCTVRLLLIALLVVVIAATAHADGALQSFDLGDFQLENGQTIKSCRLCYRTFGTLNSKKSNAVLFPTWFAGITQELVDTGFIGPGKLADTSKYYVIAVDAFGNAVSSSPSTSLLQPGVAFPQFSIRDMVNAQHTLLTRHLGLTHLFAVIGISMGGMQTFQWIVSYPDFLDNAVPISGSPRLSAYDLLALQTELQIIEALRHSGQGDNPAMRALAPAHALFSRTDHYFATKVRREDVSQMVADIQKSFSKFNADNWAWQLKAIMSHDIFRAFGGSPEKAAAATKARVLVITAQQDHLVYPEPAQAFAALIKAPTFELTGDCGHLAFLCKPEELRSLVAGFLNK